MKRHSVLAAGVAVAGLAGTACYRERSSFRTLSDSEAQTLRALCDQIVPDDDQPGADWAGVVQFIDIQLTRHYKRYRANYSQGLRKADAIATARFGRPLAELPAGEQLRAAEELERADSQFFGLLLAHTMQSFYGSPRHGGNRDAVSWRILGVSPVQVRGRS